MAYYFPKEREYIGYNRGRTSYYDNYYDNWGYSSYRENKPKKEYDRKKEWSWSNWGSSFSEDDDKELITKDSEQYSTPRSYDIERRLKKYPKTFESNMIKDLSRMFYYKMMEDPKFIKDDLDTSAMKDKELNYYSKVSMILDECFKKDVPGFSPLDKAIFVYDEMTKSGDEEVERMSMEKMTERLEEVDKLDREICDDKELHDLMELNDTLKTYKGQIFKKMSLIKHFGAKFKVEKEVTARPVQNSKLVVPEILTEFEQLPLIDKYQFALPHFKSKLALKDLNMRCPIEKTEHKQKIIILVDFSG